MRVHHHRPGLPRTVVKVLAFTVVSLVITSIVISSLLDVNTQKATGYTADFSNASGLQPGDTVRIAGVEVGKVNAVTLQNNHAVVAFSLDDSQHLSTTSLATIHFENLLGQRFLALLPGRRQGRPLAPGAVIPESRTTPAIDLTAVFDGFEPLFSALSPDQVNQLAGSIVDVFQGESGTISDVVQETAALTNNLADRQQVIDTLLNSLSSLLNTVGVHDTQLGQLIGNFDTLVTGLANSRGQIGSAIDGLASAESTTSNLITEAQPTLNEDIQTLSQAVQSLSANQHGLDGVLQGFPGLVGALTKIQSSGNWINVYLCNLTINVSGSLDVSLIPGQSPTTEYPNPVTLPSGTVGDPSPPHGELLVKRFRERNRALTGLVGIGVTLVLIAAALEFPRLPLIHDDTTYSANFASAGGLATGDIVTVDGVKVGSITGMALDGARVRITLTVAGVRLGSTTTATAKVLSPVGTEYMELSPAGAGSLGGPIPEARTSVPYNLVTDLSGLGSEIQHYNLPQLEKALDVASQDLNGTPVNETTSAFRGLAGISKVIGDEGTELATIVTQGAKLSAVLSQRSHQLFDLFGQSDLVLSVLQQRRAAIQQLLTATSSLSQQITSILSVNRPQLTTLLQDLQGVSAVLAKDSNDFGQAIPVLAAFSRYAANSTGSGAFVDAAAPTLIIPDNLVAQCAAPGALPSSNPQVGCRP